jgi:hypothetical protein
MSEDGLSQEQVTAVTVYVDIEAPPPPGEPAAHIQANGLSCHAGFT